jgi:hypothetical protein
MNKAETNAVTAALEDIVKAEDLFVSDFGELGIDFWRVPLTKADVDKLDENPMVRCFLASL